MVTLAEVPFWPVSNTLASGSLYKQQWKPCVQCSVLAKSLNSNILYIVSSHADILSAVWALSGL